MNVSCYSQVRSAAFVTQSVSPSRSPILTTTTGVKRVHVMYFLSSFSALLIGLLPFLAELSQPSFSQGVSCYWCSLSRVITATGEQGTVAPRKLLHVLPSLFHPTVLSVVLSIFRSHLRITSRGFSLAAGSTQHVAGHWKQTSGLALLPSHNKQNSRSPPTLLVSISYSRDPVTSLS